MPQQGSKGVPGTRPWPSSSWPQPSLTLTFPNPKRDLLPDTAGLGMLRWVSVWRFFPEISHT